MERVLLVVIEWDRYDVQADWSPEDELLELEELAASAGCRVAGHVLLRRHRPVAATLIGSGKWEEIAQRAREAQAGTVVVNRELSAAQQRNVEELLQAKTIDRTQLILDIFAQRARSQEGKVQVELAQLRYLMPRLAGKGVLLSRLGGGIGTRGPGEQKLEIDRRRVRTRISRLHEELEKLSRRRQATRQRRHDAEVPVVALVGYTNAGKTTLFNRLAGADSTASSRLFTTLDPLARRIRLPNGRGAILTDTVGFLHQLPHHLIEAFKATLEETHDADVLVHVLDASHPLALEQAEAVQAVLATLDADGTPRVTALNKIDRLPDPSRLELLKQRLPNPWGLSALRGDGIETFLRAVESCLMNRESNPPQAHTSSDG